uniref:Uncharacterized protein n=1 Tax=Candidatus Kentrum eta TaxID=2126337 RepID=A0A450UGZ1_9GAMM|nr:MAG: hypothetical protein BECKH772A_GA0070896_1002317 [Candidatus Kentron sp. H]VFJ91789.1 MAG: hypothetical protein BECKH772B_GA0070898_1002117 [Candidatus Kentron sp. H]VFJ98420.1 MAG: hypothetical protein BECKH772C_GA0070978_1002117 [Candidatus Kentron sp. H]
MEEKAIAPQDIMGELSAAQEYRADEFASDEMVAARAGIFIIAITFIGLQIITTLIGYSDGFDFGENAVTYYPHRQAYEKSSRILTEDALKKRDRARFEALCRRVDTVLAGYHKIALQKTERDTHTLPLHQALESRKALRFETYRAARKHRST